MKMTAREVNMDALISDLIISRDKYQEACGKYLNQIFELRKKLDELRSVDYKGALAEQLARVKQLEEMLFNARVCLTEKPEDA